LASARSSFARARLVVSARIHRHPEGRAGRRASCAGDAASCPIARSILRPSAHMPWKRCVSA
jgi:hypothetical protein